MRDSGPIVIKTESNGRLWISILTVGQNIKLPTGQTYSCDSGKFSWYSTYSSDVQRKAVIVEGGAIDSNGRGTLLTSRMLNASWHSGAQQILPKQITKLF
jgi:agmatine/peptidylarginine deiminase